MRYRLTLLFAIFCLGSTAQTERDKLTGDWKLYLKDKINFEFLRLNSDGTGLKCFGQTINGTDTLFLDHVTALRITKWETTKGKLILKSRHTVSFDVDPVYKLSYPEPDKIKLEGEHLIFYLFPSFLNRSEFQRSVIYQKANQIPRDRGVTTTKCISDETDLFSLTLIDDKSQLAVYKGFDDLIPHITGCGYGYEYATKYYDPSYSLKIPAFINKRSFGFGNKKFYISFDSRQGDSTETSIVIYYDFDNELKNFYFSEMEKGKLKKDIVNKNGLPIYRGTNWQGKYEGKVFLANSIMVAYYTRDQKLQEYLGDCITSFKYK